MSESKHTPTPYRLGTSGKAKGIIFDCAQDGPAVRIATVIDVKSGDFIVLACNSHAGLLEALKDVLQYCVTPTGMPDRDRRTLEQQAAYDNAREQIAKAEWR